MGFDQAYQVLGVDSQTPLEKIRVIFDQMRLAYHQRASNPITPSDWLTKVRYQKIVEAYALLRNRDHKTDTPMDYSLRMGIKQFLSNLQTNGSFRVVLDTIHRCTCVKVCPHCRGAAQTNCGHCEGKGWFHHCDLCNSSGVRKAQTTHCLQVPRLQLLMSWTLGCGTHMSLQLMPQDGFQLRDGKLWVIRAIDVKDYLSGNQVVTQCLGRQHRLDLQVVDRFPYQSNLRLDKTLAGINQVWIQFNISRNKTLKI